MCVCDLMGKTTYSKSAEMIGGLEKGLEIGAIKLRSNILVKIGGDERTISQAIRIMLETKLIKDIGNCHFKILKREDTK